ncbi:MAG TPA: MoaD/ThiS family protein [Streptosporangiaceae bacterium]|nr:MoaD/ThiS family protein [Streptosporangiaceae bacterium]
MANVTIRYWAAAKDAAGTGEEPTQAETLADALDWARIRHAGNSRFSAVLARSSFLVDGMQAGRNAAETVTLSDNAVIEILPAFAGG